MKRLLLTIVFISGTANADYTSRFNTSADKADRSDVISFIDAADALNAIERKATPDATTHSAPAVGTLVMPRDQDLVNQVSALNLTVYNQRRVISQQALQIASVERTASYANKRAGDANLVAGQAKIAAAAAAKIGSVTKYHLMGTDVAADVARNLGWSLSSFSTVRIGGYGVGMTIANADSCSIYRASNFAITSATATAYPGAIQGRGNLQYDYAGHSGQHGQGAIIKCTHPILY